MNPTGAGKSDFRESGIVQRLRKSVRALPFEHPHVLLACSGGKDSVALAWLLAELRRLEMLDLSIAHIHHGQHDHADLAAEAVEQIGRELEVPVFSYHLDQGDIDAHGGVGLEEAMRRERYFALHRIANEAGIDCLALAHHQTDQAETILLHLMRGAGVDGLGGMGEWELRRIPWWAGDNHRGEIGLWRPLINESAREVGEIATASGLPIVEDPTNVDPAYRRNAIRHQVLPMLEEIAAGSTSAIARSAEIVAGDARLLRQLTEQRLAEILVNGGISCARLVTHSRDLQRRIVRLWVLQTHPDLELSTDRVDAIIQAAERNRGGSTIELGLGYSVVVRAGVLRID